MSRLLVHLNPFYERLARLKYCLKNMIFGKILQVLDYHFKRLGDAYAAPPTFVFGKV
jgi:hypothetical protein